MIIDSETWACESCIRGHRTSQCMHIERELQQVTKKGRPVSQCEHCRNLRKSRSLHKECKCALAMKKGENGGSDERCICAHKKPQTRKKTAAAQVPDDHEQPAVPLHEHTSSPPAEALTNDHASDDTSPSIHVMMTTSNTILADGSVDDVAAMLQPEYVNLKDVSYGDLEWLSGSLPLLHFQAQVSSDEAYASITNAEGQQNGKQIHNAP